MLNTYLTATQNLLQNPTALQPLYSVPTLTAFINTARGVLAGESESIRVMGTLALTVGQRAYPFTSIVLPNATTLGLAGVFNVRYVWYVVGSGQKSLRPRPWPWYAQYALNNPVPVPGAPVIWAQFAQGEAGSLYVDPIPDTIYSLPLDTVCVPIPLVDDTTPEAIPYPWTDAVPFFAAYLALLSSQTGTRRAEAERMLADYETWKNRARRISNPSILPGIYEQAPNPTRANQLGLGTSGGGPT